MHKLALDDGRDKVLVSSRFAGVQQDVVHVRLHHVGEVGDSRRIRLVVEPRLSAKTWKLYPFQPLQKKCVSRMSIWDIQIRPFYRLRVLI